ncbi:CsiV family protein [Glaciecola siphonariae]|uniref:CsiV family protein n=1 Tax=Glaciecola siphonariae TaxID=521012 RepID=A0ABV9LTB2_9ALTE
MLKPFHQGLKRFGLVCSAISLLPLSLAMAQDTQSDWWFDVEFIAFKRDLLPNHAEDFDESDKDFFKGKSFDLFTLALYKAANPQLNLFAGLEECAQLQQPEQPTEQLPSLQMEIAASTVDTLTIDLEREQIDSDKPEPALEFFIEQQQSWLNLRPRIPALTCIESPDQLHYADFDRVPTRFFASGPSPLAFHGLLNEEQLYLQDFAKRVFAQRDVSPILYTAWRQPVVFGENNADYYRIYGGEKLVIASETQDEASERELEITQTITADTINKKLKALEKDLAALEQTKRASDEAEANTEAKSRSSNATEAEGLIDQNLIQDANKASAGDTSADINNSALNSSSVPASVETLINKALLAQSQVDSGNASPETSARAGSQLNAAAQGNVEGNSSIEDKSVQWELDGLFKVYLDYVNRVPYLHIDSEFMHKRIQLDIDGSASLQSYPSKQRRRIISKQIHYFDHPAFGIIVRLNRYALERPNIDIQKEEQ